MFRIKKLGFFLILAAIFTISNITLAAKPKVIFWSYAANNIEEWRKRELDIEKKFNIDLQIEQIAQAAFVQKMQATMMAGVKYPDIIEWMVESNKILDANPKRCLVIPLDKYTRNSALFKNVVASRVAWTTYGGHVYGLPHDVSPVVLVYNDTLWKSVGVDIAKIDTWDQFFAVASQLTAEKKNGKPFHYALPYDSQGLGATMWMIWQQTGAQVLDKNGHPTLDSAEFKQFVKWWKAKIDSNTMCSWDWGNFSALVKNGTLASFTSPDWWIGQVDAAAKTGKYQFKVRALPYYKKGGPRTSSWGGSFMAITRLAKNPPLLYKIMEYMQYDKSAIKTRYANTGMLPPVSAVWNNEIFKQPDARFGGQKLGELQTTLAQEIPRIISGDNFWEITYTDFNNQFTEITSGKTSVEAGLQKAQSNALKRL